MPSNHKPETFRFGSIRFDERSGEIERRDGGRLVSSRLSPQPARLLAHLIRSRPELVDADEIRGLLWPDVRVEYEQGLHTCIRQIRSALGDSASAPRYVETIPRRGYRFLAELEPASQTGDPALEDKSARGGAGHGTSRSLRRLTRGLTPTFLLVLLLLVSLGAATQRFRAAASPPIRVGVMPFEPSAADSPLAPGNGLAEAIVARLVAPGSPRLSIVGPSTTELWVGRPGEPTAGLGPLIDELELDYVVNGREISAESGARVLVEIIRADGAHLWARYLDDLPPGEEAARVIARALRAELS